MENTSKQTELIPECALCFLHAIFKNLINYFWEVIHFQGVKYIKFLSDANSIKHTVGLT